MVTSAGPAASINASAVAAMSSRDGVPAPHFPVAIVYSVHTMICVRRTQTARRSPVGPAARGAAPRRRAPPPAPPPRGPPGRGGGGGPGGAPPGGGATGGAGRSRGAPATTTRSGVLVQQNVTAANAAIGGSAATAG